MKTPRQPAKPKMNPFRAGALKALQTIMNDTRQDSDVRIRAAAIILNDPLSFLNDPLA